jgi:RND family efflux transporter MFP subunit
MRLLIANGRWFRGLFHGLLLAGLPLGCSREAEPAEKTPPAPVKWMEARQLFVEEWTEMVGTTQPLPDRAAHVSAAVEGHVVSLLQDAAGKPVVEGQHVHKGDVLARLDERIARANRDKVAADLDELKQQVRQAELAVKLDEIEVRRLETLRKEGGDRNQFLVSPVEIEKAKVTVDEARSKVRGAELRWLAGEKQLNALDEQLKLYTLTAPIDGRLGRMLVARGQTLAVGAQVVEIFDIDKEIDLLCFVPPYVARKLKVGQPVRIGSIDDQAQPKAASVEGRIYFIADQAEVDTGNFAVKVRFPNAQWGQRGNVTVKVRVLTAPGHAALTLPESALLEDQDPPVVIAVEGVEEKVLEQGKPAVEVGKARRLRARLGTRDRVLHLVEILAVDDPEKKWKGTLDTSKFVIERGSGLRNGDEIRLEVDEDDEQPAAPEKKEG